MVKLHVSEEALWLHEFVEDSLDSFRQKATEEAVGRARGGGALETSEGGAPRGSDGYPETQFMCTHVRRMDFALSCARYEEEYRSGRCVERSAWLHAVLSPRGCVLSSKDCFSYFVDSSSINSTGRGNIPRTLFEREGAEKKPL